MLYICKCKAIGPDVYRMICVRQTFVEEDKFWKEDLVVIGLFLVWLYEDMNILDGGQCDDMACRGPSATVFWQWVAVIDNEQCWLHVNGLYQSSIRLT